MGKQKFVISNYLQQRICHFMRANLGTQCLPTKRIQTPLIDLCNIESNVILLSECIVHCSFNTSKR